MSRLKMSPTIGRRVPASNTSPALSLLQLAVTAKVPTSWLLLTAAGHIVSAIELSEKLTEEGLGLVKIFKILVSYGMDYEGAASLSISAGFGYVDDAIQEEVIDFLGQINELAALDTTYMLAPMSSLEDITSYISARTNERLVIIKREADDLKHFSSVNRELMKASRLEKDIHTGFLRTAITRSHRVTWKGHPMGTEDLIEIFDLLQVSNLAPYIAYFDERGHVTRKLYTGRDLHLDRITQAKFATAANQIQLKVWAGYEDDSRLRSAATNGPALYANVIFEADTGELSINTSLIDISAIVDDAELLKRVMTTLGEAAKGSAIKVEAPKVEAPLAVAPPVLTGLKALIALGAQAQSKPGGDKADGDKAPSSNDEISSNGNKPDGNKPDGNKPSWGDKALVLDEGRIRSVSGKYTIWGVAYNREMWQHFILNNKLIREHLFVNEYKEPVALRLRPITHYQDIGDRIFMDNLMYFGDDSAHERIVTKARNGRLSVKIIPRVSGEELAIANNGIQPKGTPYLEVSIVDAQGDEVVGRFRRVLDFAFRLYREELPSIRESYLALYPSLLQIQGRRDKLGLVVDPSYLGVNRTAIVVANKMDNLRALNPTMFGDEYCTKCPRPRVPRLMSDKGDGGRGRKRKNVAIPLRSKGTFEIGDKQQEDFYCPSESASFMGSVSTDAGPAPCCFPTDPTIVKKAASGPNTGRVLATIKVASPGVRGRLPPAIETLLSQSAGQEDTEHLRIGIIEDSNSLAHAILLSSDIKYRNAKEPERRQLAMELRKELISYLRVGPQACVQELFGLDMADLITRLENNEPLDSRLFFRFFEEKFEVNIYAFISPLVDNGRQRGTFYLPRAVNRHIPMFSTRPTVALLFNRGTGRPNLARSEWDNGHYELIITMQGKNQSHYRYTEEDGEEIFKAMLEVSGQDIWRRDSVGRLTGYRNPGAHLNLREVLGMARGQVLNSQGHAIKSLYTIDKSTFVLSSIATAPDGSPVVEESDLPRPTIDVNEVIKLFGPPTELALDADGMVVKCWFAALGIPDCLNLECAPSKVGPTLRLVPVRVQELEPVQEAKVKGIIGRYRATKRTVDIVVEIVKWLFDIYRMTDDRGLIFFRETFFIGRQEVVDVSRIPYYLGEPDGPLISVEKALEYMGKTMDIVRDIQVDGVRGKVLAVGNYEFYDRINSMLLNYQQSSLPDEAAFRKRHIHAVYRDHTDLKPQSKSQIIVGKENFNRQVIAETRLRGVAPVRMVRANMANLPTPYMYQSDESYYLIVNIGDQYKPRAWNVYYQWMLSQRLAPFSDSPVEEPAYALYRIGDSNQIEAYDDHTGGEAAHCRILDYETTLGNYAVMLPLGVAI